MLTLKELPKRIADTSDFKGHTFLKEVVFERLAVPIILFILIKKITNCTMLHQISRIIIFAFGLLW